MDYIVHRLDELGHLHERCDRAASRACDWCWNVFFLFLFLLWKQFKFDEGRGGEGAEGDEGHAWLTPSTLVSFRFRP